MFRRLYWVTEELDAAGKSRVTGAYTSIPDLMARGIRWTGQPASALRLTLVKLDCERAPLGVFTGPRFEGLEESLAEFIQTDEFSEHDCVSLCETLREFSSVTSR